MGDVIITVRGEHETRLPPEEAVVRLSVRTDGTARAEVVTRIAALAEPVREELGRREAEGSLVEWSSRRAAVWSQRPSRNDGQRTSPVHHASVDFAATFADFTELSLWVSEVAEHEGVALVAIDWRLTPQTRRSIDRETAAQAVRVAVDRAGAYADAIDLDSVTPLEIADAGLISEHRPVAAAHATGFTARAGAGGNAPAVQLEPEDIVVTATVEGRFTAR